MKHKMQHKVQSKSVSVNLYLSKFIIRDLKNFSWK